MSKRQATRHSKTDWGNLIVIAVILLVAFAFVGYVCYQTGWEDGKEKLRQNLFQENNPAPEEEKGSWI